MTKCLCQRKTTEIFCMTSIILTGFFILFVGSNIGTVFAEQKKTINKTSNIIEREVTVHAPPFMDRKAHPIITIYPEKLTIVENQTHGL